MKSLAYLIILFLLPGCTGLFFHPETEHVITPATLGLEYSDVFFDNNGLKLHAWFLKARKKPKGTVLFLHGNAENISTHIASVYWLLQSEGAEPPDLNRKHRHRQKEIRGM